MAQVFHPSTNTISRVTIFGALFAAVAMLFVIAAVERSPYRTQEKVARQQPVPFYHIHHAGEIGIDCRYCHTSVEESAYAGIPPTATCINCHSHLYKDSPTLEPVRESFRSGVSLRWQKVHDLADFVFFDHSIHISKGVACVTCHGRVDRMSFVYKNESLQMEWCLNCHRNPEPNLVPREQVFNMDWEPPADRAALGRELAERYDVHTRLDCSTCHR